jgi:hypothetical protein
VYEIEADSSFTAEEHASEKGQFLFETRQFIGAESVEEGE